MSHADAFEVQIRHVNDVLASREARKPEMGRVLLVEHDPVITVSRRPGAGNHLLASHDQLKRLSVEVAQTDRGGDITYHGPGQLVAYPILDLNRLNLGLHAYMRLLEQAVIDTCSAWGVVGVRDSAATGVWVSRNGSTGKIGAMGVRVKRWVSMHGLSLNVAPDMSHFGLIVPCGLAGRAVTSLAIECAAAGRGTPGMADVTAEMETNLCRLVRDAAARADEGRAAATDPQVMGSR